VSDRELLTECLEALTHDAAQRTFAGGVRMSQLAIKLRAALAAPEPEQKFDHSIGADRFKVVRGIFWWHIKIGDSPTEHGKFRSSAAAQKMADDLLREFRNGAFAQNALAAPRPEPVAWMYVNSEGECEQIEYGTEAIDDDSITPLYAAPPAAAPSEDIETLRRENERLQNLLYDQMGKVFASRAAEQMRKQIAELKHAENERLRGLLAEAQKAVWMNYDGDLLDRIEAALKEVPR
jgi:hypothetical protein